MESSTVEAAKDVFGTNYGLAVRYAEFLCTAGLERGLIGPREPDRIWERHILNCAALATAIPDVKSGRIKVSDVGSGAGLPGIPLFLARPDLEIVLIEPLQRRAEFLSEFIEEINTCIPMANIIVVRGRAEAREILGTAGKADIVTARAVAPLGKLTRWCAPLIRENGQLIALKGETVMDEVKRDAKEIVRAGIVDPTYRIVSVPGADPTYLFLGKKLGSTRGKQCR